MVQVLRFVFAVPVVAGAVWTLTRRRQEVKGWIAAVLLLYGVVYIAVFHYGLKAF